MHRNIAKKGRCRVCDKVTFRDEKSAKRAIAEVKRFNPDSTYVPQRWYWCDEANGFHLTHTDDIVGYYAEKHKGEQEI